MRPCSVALDTFLSDPLNLSVIQIDLYTFALVGGPTLRYSGGVTPLTVPSAGFPTGSLNAGASRTFDLGVRFGRSKVSTKVGVEATELDVEVYAAVGDEIGATPFGLAVSQGAFDGATVELDRLFAPPQPTGSGALDLSLGTMIWFYGRVADIDLGRSKITIKVKSLMNLLAIQQMPRRLFGAPCTHVFGDAMCGYNRTAGKNALGASTGIGAVAVTAGSGSDKTHIVSPFAPSPATAYDNGTLTGVTGANTGASRTISQVTGGSTYLVSPFLSTVSVGDAFTALPGCDHTVATCNGALNNYLRFGGFAFIPPPENAI